MTLKECDRLIRQLEGYTDLIMITGFSGDGPMRRNTHLAYCKTLVRLTEAEVAARHLKSMLEYDVEEDE